MISLIVACANGGAIGRANTIPWHAPEDLRFFQRETAGAAVIMGRNTWDSLPFKPLKNRLNIVVSSRSVAAEHVVPSVQAALDLAQAQGHRRVYGIGGRAIYAEMLGLAHRLLITEVDLNVADADTFFPSFAPQDWALIGQTPLAHPDFSCVVKEFLRAPPLA
jgi:dihydrofolate reductase